MKDIVLSEAQVKAIKTIPKIGQINFKSFGIQKNTIESLKRYGIVTETFPGYVSRIV